MSNLLHQRILVKFSGESVAGDDEHGIDPKILDQMASSVASCKEIGAQIGIVIGGGNLFRGEKLNKARMDPEKYEAMWNKGVRHMIFAIKLYRIQSESGRFFLHEHPASASSWKLPEMQALMSDLNISKINTHMCRFGMTSHIHGRKGEHGPVKKPTGFATSSPCIAKRLALKCQGGHEHVHLMGGRAAGAQVYPEALCEAIVEGVV